MQNRFKGGELVYISGARMISILCYASVLHFPVIPWPFLCIEAAGPRSTME
jgi:hypothetical protein